MAAASKDRGNDPLWYTGVRAALFVIGVAAWVTRLFVPATILEWLTGIGLIGMVIFQEIGRWYINRRERADAELVANGG